MNQARCPRCNAGVIRSHGERGCIACGWEDDHGAAARARAVVAAETQVQRDFVARTRAENLARERLGLEPVALAVEPERTVRLPATDRPQRGDHAEAMPRPIETSPTRAELRKRTRATFPRLDAAPTEHEMVAYLRARGYVVFTPEQLRTNASRVGSAVTARRRAEGTLDAHMATMRSHINQAARRAPEPAHGTPERYWRKAWRCRCEDCRAAMLAYLAQHPSRQMRERNNAQRARASRMVTCRGCGTEFRLGTSDPRRAYCDDGCKGRAAYRRRAAKAESHAADGAGLTVPQLLM